jgi:hypothetical protein
MYEKKAVGVCPLSFTEFQRANVQLRHWAERWIRISHVVDELVGDVGTCGKWRSGMVFIYARDIKWNAAVVWTQVDLCASRSYELGRGIGQKHCRFTHGVMVESILPS